jgi:hypothetical protein
VCDVFIELVDGEQPGVIAKLTYRRLDDQRHAEEVED